MLLEDALKASRLADDPAVNLTEDSGNQPPKYAPWGDLPGDAAIVAALPPVRRGERRDERFLPKPDTPWTTHLLRRMAPDQMLDRGAANLFRYFEFRARRRGYHNYLPRRWFREQLALGCRAFHGVLVPDKGDLIEDAQRPDAFRAFHRRKQEAATPMAEAAD